MDSTRNNPKYYLRCEIYEEGTGLVLKMQKTELSKGVSTIRQFMQMHTGRDIV